MRWQSRVIMVGILVNFAVYFLAALAFWQVQTQRVVGEVAKFAMATSQLAVLDLIMERIWTRNAITEQYSTGLAFQPPISKRRSLFNLVDVRKFNNGEFEVLYSQRKTNDLPPDLLEQKRSSFLRFGTDKKLYATSTYSGVTYMPTPYNENEIPGTFALTYEVQFKPILQYLKDNSMIFVLMEFDKDYNYDIIYSDLQEEDNASLVKATEYINDEVIDTITNTSIRPNGYRNARIATFKSTKHLLYPISISENTGIRQLIFTILPLPDYRPIDKDSAFIFVMALFITALGCFILGFVKTI